MKAKNAILILLAILAWIAFQRRLKTEVTSTIRYGIFPGEDVASANEYDSME